MVGGRALNGPLRSLDGHIRRLAGRQVDARQAGRDSRRSRRGLQTLSWATYRRRSATLTSSTCDLPRRCRPPPSTRRAGDGTDAELSINRCPFATHHHRRRTVGALRRHRRQAARARLPGARAGRAGQFDLQVSAADGVLHDAGAARDRRAAVRLAVREADARRGAELLPQGRRDVRSADRVRGDGAVRRRASRTEPTGEATRCSPSRRGRRAASGASGTRGTSCSRSATTTSRTC